MTTIAWDGRSLAADRQTTAGGTPTETCKVFEAFSPTGERWLYGCAGNSGECHEFTRRVQTGLEMPAFNDLQVLAIGPDGSIWVAGSPAMFWDRKGTDKWAAGSGADYALGAMRAGATAFMAVEIATALDVHTGLGVDVLEFVK